MCTASYKCRSTATSMAISYFRIGPPRSEQTMHSRHMLLATCLLGWAGVSAGAPDAQNASTVQAKDAWVRWLPGNLPAGGYVTLVNTSDRPISLVAASCPDYGVVSLHRSRNVAGTSQIMRVDKIT